MANSVPIFYWTQKTKAYKKTMTVLLIILLGFSAFLFVPELPISSQNENINASHLDNPFNNRFENGLNIFSNLLLASFLTVSTSSASKPPTIDFPKMFINFNNSWVNETGRGGFKIRPSDETFDLFTTYLGAFVGRITDLETIFNYPEGNDPLDAVIASNNTNDGGYKPNPTAENSTLQATFAAALIYDLLSNISLIKQNAIDWVLGHNSSDSGFHEEFETNSSLEATFYAVQFLNITGYNWTNPVTKNDVFNYLTNNNVYVNGTDQDYFTNLNDTSKTTLETTYYGLSAILGLGMTDSLSAADIADLTAFIINNQNNVTADKVQGGIGENPDNTSLSETFSGIASLSIIGLHPSINNPFSGLNITLLTDFIKNCQYFPPEGPDSPLYGGFLRNPDSSNTTVVFANMFSAVFSLYLVGDMVIDWNGKTTTVDQPDQETNAVIEGYNVSLSVKPYLYSEGSGHVITSFNISIHTWDVPSFANGTFYYFIYNETSSRYETIINASSGEQGLPEFNSSGHVGVNNLTIWSIFPNISQGLFPLINLTGWFTVIVHYEIKFMFEGVDIKPPGDTVDFYATLSNTTGILTENKTLGVELINPSNFVENTTSPSQIDFNATNFYKGNVSIPRDAPLGNFTVRANVWNSSGNHTSGEFEILVNDSYVITSFESPDQDLSYFIGETITNLTLIVNYTQFGGLLRNYSANILFDCEVKDYKVLLGENLTYSNGTIYNYILNYTIPSEPLLGEFPMFLEVNWPNLTLAEREKVATKSEKFPYIIIGGTLTLSGFIQDLEEEINQYGSPQRYYIGDLVTYGFEFYCNETRTRVSDLAARLDATSTDFYINISLNQENIQIINPVFDDDPLKRNYTVKSFIDPNLINGTYTLTVLVKLITNGTIVTVSLDDTTPAFKSFNVWITGSPILLGIDIIFITGPVIAPGDTLIVFFFTRALQTNNTLIGLFLNVTLMDNEGVELYKTNALGHSGRWYQIVLDISPNAKEGNYILLVYRQSDGSFMGEIPFEVRIPEVVKEGRSLEFYVLISVIILELLIVLLTLYVRYKKKP
ncbi:MAG: hypothetical protein Q6362_002090 [Candidatus Wukongarchaeota archaeon]|nr:hypothetical protein [Candidatus Wukongarchaeota archaeon]